MFAQKPGDRQVSGDGGENETMTVFKVLSLNVRGLRDNVKRRAPLKIDSWLDVTAFSSFQMKILQ